MILNVFSGTSCSRRHLQIVPFDLLDIIFYTKLIRSFHHC